MRSASLAAGIALAVCLTMPRVAEACPNGLAPTTSTLMTLALGDALAMVLMDRRGFTAMDFGLHHPGGSLGMSLQTVREWMGDNAAAAAQIADAVLANTSIVAARRGFRGSVALGVGGGGVLHRHAAVFPGWRHMWQGCPMNSISRSIVAPRRRARFCERMFSGSIREMRPVKPKSRAPASRAADAASNA